MKELDEILNGETVPAEPVVEPTAPEANRDERGRFASKGEKEPEQPEAEPVGDASPAPQRELDHAALLGERKRRQDAEGRASDFERQLADVNRRLQEATAQPPAPPPSIFEDEAGAFSHFGQRVVSEATFHAKLDMSEMMVRQTHPDFEEKKSRFLELMRETPGLQQKALSDPHPWNYAYTYVQNVERMKELEAVNVADLEAKLRAKITAELQAAAPAPSIIPNSLADAQSARGGASAGYAPPTLESILGRK